MLKTKIHIDASNSIRNLQERFSGIFPFLRIDFFKKWNDERRRISQEIMFLPEVRMDEMNKNFLTGDLEFDNTMTVAEFENSFKNQFGLDAKIFRRSGNSWIGPTMTNSWTLQEQNDLGREISENQDRFALL